MTPYEIITLALIPVVGFGFLLVSTVLRHHDAEINSLRNGHYRHMKENAELSMQIWELAQAAGFERVEKNPQTFYRKKQGVRIDTNE